MTEIKFMGKTLLLDSLEDLEVKNAVFSIEFDYNYKAILLRTKRYCTLQVTLQAFIWASRHNMYGLHIKKCINSSNTITVCVVYRYEGDTSCIRLVNMTLQIAFAHKIVELCTYAPHGYNLKVSQNCFYDDNMINRLVEKELRRAGKSTVIRK